MSGNTEQDISKEVAELISITGVDDAKARHLLAACGNDVKSATQLHFDVESSSPAPILRHAQPDPEKKKKNEEMFVGGGQAVMYPDADKAETQPKMDLFGAFKSGGAKTNDEDAAEQRAAGGRKLEGGDYQAPSGRKEVQVTITAWKNGVSINDGELIEDTETFQKELKEGKVPRQVVQRLRADGLDPTQLEVVLTLQSNAERDYVKEFKAFAGSGRTLGATGAEAQPTQPLPPKKASIQVDDTKEVTTVQICLPDGTRLRARFNLTHTVGDIANYVLASSRDITSFSLMTTFPRQKLTDYSATIADANLAKSVVTVSL